MPRRFLFILVVSFAVTLGYFQRAPTVACVVLAVAGCGLVITAGAWRSGILYAVAGVGLGLMALAVRQPSTQFTIGELQNIEGIVTRQAGTQSWVSVQQCGNHPCPAGVVLDQPFELGQRLDVACELLELPDPQSPWRWWKQGMVATCNPRGEARRLQPAGIGWLYRLRVSLRERINTAFAPRQAGLLAGILFGDTSAMPMEVATDFRRTGTTHIVALSGFNITIIMQTLVGGLLPLVGKRWTTVLGLLLVTLFVVTTGASSSVVRASVMAAIVQAVRLIGRPVYPDRVILMTILLMSLQNPWLLWHDLGFQLSMTSTFGLMQLRDGLDRFGSWIPTWWELRDNAISTSAASLASAPIILSTFGGWSLISLPANVLVLPFIPLIMGLGAVTIPALWLPPEARDMIVAPVDVLLRSVVHLLHVCAGVPWAYRPLPTIVITGCIFLSTISIAYLYASRHLVRRQ